MLSCDGIESPVDVFVDDLPILALQAPYHGELVSLSSGQHEAYVRFKNGLGSVAASAKQVSEVAGLSLLPLERAPGIQGILVKNINPGDPLTVDFCRDLANWEHAFSLSVEQEEMAITLFPRDGIQFVRVREGLNPGTSDSPR